MKRDIARRRGVSIIEVLFSILVTTVGLFGAIALFPVASSQARRARTNDAVAAAGRQAVHTFDMMGMRRPDRWVAWQGGAVSRFVPITTINPNALTLGASFCIDSRFVTQRNNIGVAAAEVFPYISNFNGPGGVNANGQSPRMQRVAFLGFLPYFNGTAPVVTVAGNKLLADSIFQLEDDLAFARPGMDEDVINPATNLALPNDRSLAAVQLFDRQTQVTTSGTNVTLTKRQTFGHLSWMATLVPKVDLALGAPSDEYTLSIVVFEDRPLTDSPTQIQADDVGERVVSVQLLDDGSTGGEVLLTVPDVGDNNGDGVPDSPARLKLRANDWIMLGCNLNFNFGGQPATLNRFQWYRVTHCDAEPTLNSNTSNYELYATLIGPDWTWPVQNKVPNSDMAVLVTGVVSVHEKSIRLDSGSAF